MDQSKMETFSFEAEFVDQGARYLITLNKDELNFDVLRRTVHLLYPHLASEYILKYRDNEDLVTIASDHDLQEAINWCNSLKRENLYLFVVGKGDEKNNLFGITKMFMNMSLNTEEGISAWSGSEWTGKCSYENGDDFPFTLYIHESKPIKKKQLDIEGTLTWHSLQASTKFLGTIDDNTHIKFREYEAISGEENVEIPCNYLGEVEGRSIKGTIANKERPKFVLEFAGIRSSKGFLELNDRKSNSHKRKYNLWTSNSNEPPTVQDYFGSFKKLVSGSECWYDKTKTGELQPRKVDTEDVRKSCRWCEEPLFERSISDNPNEVLLVCSNYPYCHPQY